MDKPLEIFSCNGFYLTNKNDIFNLANIDTINNSNFLRFEHYDNSFGIFSIDNFKHVTVKPAIDYPEISVKIVLDKEYGLKLLAQKMFNLPRLTSNDKTNILNILSNDNILYCNMFAVI